MEWRFITTKVYNDRESGTMANEGKNVNRYNVDASEFFVGPAGIVPFLTL
jgi:hypothetical protein